MKNLPDISQNKTLFVILMALVSMQSCVNNTPNLALGTLERDRIAHTATANEVVIALPVSRRERVSVGDVLVQLDSRQQSALTAKAAENI
jgi:HlyD family secretion protein